MQQSSPRPLNLSVSPLPSVSQRLSLLERQVQLLTVRQHIAFTVLRLLVAGHSRELWPQREIFLSELSSILKDMEEASSGTEEALSHEAGSTSGSQAAETPSTGE